MPNELAKPVTDQFTQELTQVVSPEKLVEFKDQTGKQESLKKTTDSKLPTESKDSKDKASVEKTPDNLAKEKRVNNHDPNLYRIMFFMKHFRMHDIVIKLVGDDTLVIDASHKEYIDEHGFATRSVVRKQKLPDDIVKEKLVSWLTADGVLIIQAPRVGNN